VDWSIDRDALMLVAGDHAVLHVRTASTKGVNITNIQAATGVTMAVRQRHAAPGHPAVLDVAAGTRPGFYRFTVTGKTATGHTETQSGWIVVGAPGSLPARQQR
jgi:hypothetical protein